ncbi:TPA: hypothetical protein ACGO1T_001820 [Streptococcus suis]
MKKIIICILLLVSLTSTGPYSLSVVKAKSYPDMETMALDILPMVIKLQSKESQDEISKLKSDDYELIKYEDIMRKREGLVDVRHQFFAEVQQYSESDGIAEGLLMRDGDIDKAYYFIIPNLPDSRLMEDDKVDIYGTLHGLLTYKTVMGGSKTVPVIIVDKVLVEGIDY